MPRLLFLGDIVGRPGRAAVRDLLPGLVASENIGLVVANAENAAAGAGLTADLARELKTYGCQALTLGDHCWDQKGFDRDIGGLDWVCRPANLPAACPGRTHLILEKDGFRLLVATVLGRTFMGPKADCPFLAADAFCARRGVDADAVFIEIHAEATSEKISLGRHLDGRACAVVGTHTHVPTADLRVLPKGTAYLTDAGMTGPYDSCLGRELAPVIARFLDGMPRQCPVAEGDPRMCGALFNLDASTGLCTAARRVELTYSDA
jgi:2',3'-cyclic-nucleotide 2'-phosphodiesterase